MLTKFIYTVVFKPLIQFYLRFNVGYNYDGFKLRVLPGVFHPGFFFSTTFFYRFLKQLALKDKTLLEVGSGSGLLSLLAFRQGAHVTAIDKDSLAVENTRLNLKKNFKLFDNFHVLKSDLFQNLSIQTFDFIIINPPYFFKAVETNTQLAWNCGKNGEYFEGLFENINGYLNSNSEVYMVLAENCDIERIKLIAKKHGYILNVAAKEKIKWETNFIYKIHHQALLSSLIG